MNMYIITDFHRMKNNFFKNVKTPISSMQGNMI